MHVIMALIEANADPVITLAMRDFRGENTDAAWLEDVKKRTEGLVPVVDYSRAVWDFYALGSVRFIGPLDVHQRVDGIETKGGHHAS